MPDLHHTTIQQTGVVAGEPLRLNDGTVYRAHLMTTPNP